MKRCGTVNELKIAEYLVENGPATRGEVVEAMSIKRTTVHDCLERLHVKGILRRDEEKIDWGRPKVVYHLVGKNN